MTPYLEKAAEALRQINSHCSVRSRSLEWFVADDRRPAGEVILGPYYSTYLDAYEALLAHKIRAVAEALYPETPERERIEAMAREVHGYLIPYPEDGCPRCEHICEIAYETERKLVLGP